MNDLTEGRARARPLPAAPPPALPWLVADVGGTNARFGWVASATGGIEHVATLPTTGFAGPTEAAQAYLDDLRSRLGAAFAAPRRSAWAIATAVDREEIQLTNSNWRFVPPELQAALGVERLQLLNDFEALALSLPRLTAAQLRPHGPLPTARGTLAVIGPGTGLGVAGVVETAHGWVAVPGEGGHVTLAAGDDFEGRLLQQVRRRYPHVSAERLLSGIGLPVLHAAVSAVLGLGLVERETPEIVTLGLAGEDVACDRTLDTFCALLGGFAGNVALTLGATGGVYIGGGIVPRLGDRFFASRFRERFEAKGRFAGYLAAVPTAVITDTLAALSGAAQAIAQDDV